MVVLAKRWGLVHHACATISGDILVRDDTKCARSPHVRKVGEERHIARPDQLRALHLSQNLQHQVCFVFDNQCLCIGDRCARMNTKGAPLFRSLMMAYSSHPQPNRQVNAKPLLDQTHP